MLWRLAGAFVIYLCVNEDELIRLLTGERTNPISVGRISDRVAAALGALTTVIHLSSDTVYKQETKRVQQNTELYMRVPLILDTPYIIIQPPRKAVYIYHERTDKLRSFKAVVKATKRKDELFLVSVHRVDRSDVRAAFRNGIRLTEFERKKGA